MKLVQVKKLDLSVDTCQRNALNFLSQLHSTFKLTFCNFFFLVLGDMNNLGVQISPLQHPKTEVALLTPEAHSKIDAQIDTWSFAKHTWSDNGCKVEVKFNGLLNLSIAECPNIGIYSVSQPRFGEVNQGVYFWHFVQRMEAPVQIGTGVCVLFCLLIVITFTIFHR